MEAEQTKRPSSDGRKDTTTARMLPTPTPRLALTPSLAGFSQESTTAREHLTDPFDGSTIGILLPAPPLPELPPTTSGETSTQVLRELPRGEELWAQLSRVLELQTDIARAHADMEGIGANKGKAKTGESKDRGSSKGHGQSQTDPGSEEYDMEGEGVEMDDEETERNRAREEEFAKLADQFSRRKESINDMMSKLDDLSKALTEFHALQAPEVKMPPSRGNSMGVVGIHDPPPSAILPAMSFLGLPPPTHELKPILPFIQRAHEVRQQEPVVAYWCSYYAAQQGLAVQAKDPSSRQFLFALVDLLERMKKEIAPSDAIDNEAAGCACVENFAFRVFSLADNEDRKGNATRATAKKFLAAANFLEVLSVFPKTEISDNIDEKIRYAKWKAADIAKAFREGRSPIPGPASSNAEEPPTIGNLEATGQTNSDATREPAIPPPLIESETEHAPRSAWVSEELEGQSSPVSVTPPPVPQRPLNVGIAPTAPSFPPDVNPNWNTAPAQSPTEDINYTTPWFAQSPPPVPSAPPYVPLDAGLRLPPAPPTPPTIPNPVPVPVPPAPRPQEELAPSLVVKIQKHCRYAISALDYEDAEQAKRELRAALNLLGG